MTPPSQPAEIRTILITVVMGTAGGLLLPIGVPNARTDDTADVRFLPTDTMIDVRLIDTAEDRKRSASPYRRSFREGRRTPPSPQRPLVQSQVILNSTIFTTHPFSIQVVRKLRCGDGQGA